MLEIAETLVPAGGAVIASSEKAWEFALLEMIRNPSHREEMGRKAYEWAKVNLSIEEEARKVLVFIEQQMSKDVSA